LEFLEDKYSDEEDQRFIVKFSAWEGPIEAMLELARSQKIDLIQIDILDLVSQFEAVIGRAMALRMELAADWLVMAAWMTYLKSRILLKQPKSDGKEELSEDALAFHLKRLDAVKTAAEKIQKQVILNKDWFGPGGAGGASVQSNRINISFHDFLAAYPKPKEPYFTPEPRILKPFDLASVDEAISRLKSDMPMEWTNLVNLIPKSTGLRLRSNIATSLIGTLELARNGLAEIKQSDLMEPIYVKRKGHE
jgi:segregation and condensation protein A